MAERFASGWLDGIIGPHFWTTLCGGPAGPRGRAACAGILTGILLARSRLAARMLSPYIVAAQATPILALAPLIALWFGTGLGSRVLICALICFFPIAVGTMVGIRSVDPKLIELGRSFRAQPPPAADAHRGAVGPAPDPGQPAHRRHARGRRRHRGRVGRRRLRAWACSSTSPAAAMFDIPLMFATLITIALMGIALYLIVVAIERRLVRTPS